MIIGVTAEGTSDIAATLPGATAVAIHDIISDLKARPAK